VTTTRAFELYLISLMQGRPHVESVLRSLGISSDEMLRTADEVALEVGFLELVPRHLDAYCQILGLPLETTVEPGIRAGNSYAGSKRHRFHLPLWPDFDFLLRTHPAGWIWGPEFVRRPGAPIPSPTRVTELQSWTVVESEVVARFGPFALEEAWNLGKDGSYLLTESVERFEVKLVFDLALLQQVQVTRRPLQ
jgi:hypothetical protein